MVPSDPTLRAEEPLQPIKEQTQACGGLRLQRASGKPVAEKEIRMETFLERRSTEPPAFVPGLPKRPLSPAVTPTPGSTVLRTPHGDALGAPAKHQKEENMGYRAISCSQGEGSGWSLINQARPSAQGDGRGGLSWTFPPPPPRLISTTSLRQHY